MKNCFADAQRNEECGLLFLVKEKVIRILHFIFPLFFNLSIFQFFNFSIFQSFNLSIFQFFNFSIFQSFNLSIFQFFNLSIFQFFNFSIFQSFNLSIFQSFNFKCIPSAHPILPRYGRCFPQAQRNGTRCACICAC